VFQILAIAGGGALGALGRFWMSAGIHRLAGRGFPWGTLAVNALGSFMMGLLFVLLVDRLATGPEVRSAILVGFLGAFTTFSTFSVETVALIEAGFLWKAFLNMWVSLLLCLLACWLGVILGRSV
jgi:CrcB protein